MFGLFKKKIPEGMMGDSERISALLQKVKEQNAVVSVQVPGSSVWYDTRVVALDPRQELLALDRVKEERGHQRIIDSKRFSFVTRCNGVISFNTELVPILKEGEINRYIIRIPEYIEYRERRAPAAAVFNLSSPITLIGKGVKVRGYLSDVSRTELGLRTKDMVPFNPGDEIASCNFEVVNVSISGRLRLTSKQLDTIAHETRLRGEILDVSEAQLWELDRTIAQLSLEHKIDSSA